MINVNESDIDKNILIKQLEDFCDFEKYSIKDLARFLYGNGYLRVCFEKCINKFIYYLDSEKELIELYCSLRFNRSSIIAYCVENKIDDGVLTKYLKVIDDIEENCLGVFYAISRELLKKIFIQEISDTLCTYIVYYLTDEYMLKAINYIIKFYICSDYEHVALNMIRFTKREREVISLIRLDKTIKEIAAELGMSRDTAKQHKDNITRKIRDLNIQEYENLRPLALIKRVANEIIL